MSKFNPAVLITHCVIIRIDNRIFGDNKISSKKLYVYNQIARELNNLLDRTLTNKS